MGSVERGQKLVEILLDIAAQRKNIVGDYWSLSYCKDAAEWIAAALRQQEQLAEHLREQPEPKAEARELLAAEYEAIGETSLAWNARNANTEELTLHPRAALRAIAAALREQPEARGVVDGPSWKPIDELPSSDDLFWFARGDTVDGPRPPQFGGYDAEEWDWFAPAEAPPFTAAQQPGQAGGGARLTNPWTGEPRDYRDVNSDPAGTLCVEPGAPLKAAPPSAPVGINPQHIAADIVRSCAAAGIEVEALDVLASVERALTQQPAQAAPKQCHHINTVRGTDGVRWCKHCRQQLATPPGDDAAGGG